MRTDKSYSDNKIFIISILILLINTILVFTIVNFSRIVYVLFFYHVASAWIAYLSFTVSFICHLLFLRKKQIHLFYYAKNSVIIGLFFAAFTLISGSIWFNATSGNYNNVFWQWRDARQTTTLILFISYSVYLIFGNAVIEKDQKIKLMSVLGIVLFPTVPLSYISIILFTSLHPSINPNPGQSGNIYWDAVKITLLLVNLIGITLFYIYTVKQLVVIDNKKEELEKLIQKKIDGEE